MLLLVDRNQQQPAWYGDLLPGLSLHIVLYHICSYAAGYFQIFFTQQVAPYSQDLGLTTTGSMQMNWLYRSEAYFWYFLPPIISILIHCR